jgi:hypothetical protein
MLDKKLRIVSPLAILALAAIALAGCGGAGTSATGPDPADATGHLSLLSQRFDNVEAGGVRVVDFSLPRNGILGLRVAWTDENDSVVAVLTGAGCPDYNRADCNARGSVGAGRGKADREGEASYPVAAGAYRLWLRNEGPGVESISVSAELTYAVDAPATDPQGDPGRRGPAPEHSPRTR